MKLAIRAASPTWAVRSSVVVVDVASSREGLRGRTAGDAGDRPLDDGDAHRRDRVQCRAGIGAAALGGSLTDLGSGYGGLWGVPDLLLTFVALILGVAAAIKMNRALRPGVGRLRLAVLVLVGAWAVAIGYSSVAHVVDPCVNGWWDANSRIGTQPLCERFGPELNWHTRFHLLAHAAPAAILLVAYLWTIRRWGTRNSDEPDRDEMVDPSAIHGAG